MLPPLPRFLSTQLQKQIENISRLHTKPSAKLPDQLKPKSTAPFSMSPFLKEYCALSYNLVIEILNGV